MFSLSSPWELASTGSFSTRCVDVHYTRGEDVVDVWVCVDVHYTRGEDVLPSVDVHYT